MMVPKYGAVSVILTLFCMNVWQFQHPRTVGQAQTVVREKTKVVEKVVYKQVIAYTPHATFKPHRPVIVRKKEQETNSTHSVDSLTEARQATRIITSEKESSGVASRYLVGMGCQAFKACTRLQDVEVLAGARLGNLPLFAYARLSLTHGVGLGLQLEF